MPLSCWRRTRGALVPVAVLATLSVLSFVGGTSYAAFLALPREAEAAFGVTGAMQTALQNSYPVAWAVGLLPAIRVAGTRGPRAALRAASVLCLTGTLIALVAATAGGKLLLRGAPMGGDGGAGLLALFGSDFAPVLLLAQMFCGVGAVFYSGIPAAVSGVWAAPGLRATATAVPVAGFRLGVMVGQFVMPLAIGPLPPGLQPGDAPEVLRTSIRHGFTYIFAGQAFFLAVTTAAAVFLPTGPAPHAEGGAVAVAEPEDNAIQADARETGAAPDAVEPFLGGSGAAAVAHVAGARQRGLCGLVVGLLGRRAFLALTVGASLFAVMPNWGASQRVVLRPFGVTRTGERLAETVFMGCGVASTVAVGGLFDAVGRRRLWLAINVLVWGVVLAIALQGASFFAANAIGAEAFAGVSLAVVALAGAAYHPLIALQLMFAVELSHPAPPAVAPLLLLAVGQVGEWMLTTLFDRIAGTPATQSTAILWWAATLASAAVGAYCWGSARASCGAADARFAGVATPELVAATPPPDGAVCSKLSFGADIEDAKAELHRGARPSTSALGSNEGRCSAKGSAAVLHEER